jgi:hypothetical protein
LAKSNLSWSECQEELGSPGMAIFESVYEWACLAWRLHQQQENLNTTTGKIALRSTEMKPLYIYIYQAWVFFFSNLVKFLPTPKSLQIFSFFPIKKKEKKKMGILLNLTLLC